MRVGGKWGTKKPIQRRKSWKNVSSTLRQQEKLAEIFQLEEKYQKPGSTPRNEDHHKWLFFLVKCPRKNQI